MKVMMVAAENGALPGGKVGGMGDVVRDIPRALARLGHQVEVVVPGYQYFSTLPGAVSLDVIKVPFRGEEIGVELLQLPEDPRYPGIRTWVLDHPLFAPMGAGRIYCDDPPERPFASDASKFALFSLAVAQLLLEQRCDAVDVVHLHDWHTALLAVVLSFDPAYAPIRQLPLVYTIHNLSLQGIRPLAGDESSLHGWCPQLAYNYAEIHDPRYLNCFNPMRAAINLCQRVHGVSPHYIEEIQRPSQPERGFVGGEGLELDLQRASHEGRLKGILNGCEYSGFYPATDDFSDLLGGIREKLEQWLHLNPQPVHHDALHKISFWQERGEAPGLLATSVGRVVDQKVRILRQPMGDGRSCLEHLLDVIDGGGLMIMLGSGEAHLEGFCRHLAEVRDNFIFLQGYSDEIAQQLYNCGDLFLMPSSFEPCGISQMLAMRSGQPCLVHHVGGLADTVTDGVNGFSFSGESTFEQAQAMIWRFGEVLHVKANDPQRWQAIRQSAADARFLWSDVAMDYVEQLYS